MWHTSIAAVNEKVRDLVAEHELHELHGGGSDEHQQQFEHAKTAALALLDANVLGEHEATGVHLSGHLADDPAENSVTVTINGIRGDAVPAAGS